MQTPDAPPGTTPAARRASVLLLQLTAIIQLGFGVAAIAGMTWLEDNVRDIESNVNFGHMYLSLAGWGVLLVLAALAEFGAARSLRRAAVLGRTYGLLAALLGLGVGFFTLSIFHAATFVPLFLLLCAMYVLSYRVD